MGSFYNVRIREQGISHGVSNMLLKARLKVHSSFFYPFDIGRTGLRGVVASRCATIIILISIAADKVVFVIHFVVVVFVVAYALTKGFTAQGNIAILVSHMNFSQTLYLDVQLSRKTCRCQYIGWCLVGTG
ncbi:hypothetical protein BC939DRAFT_463775 [Gamsiella multidivaricata]|uniref:uncharacterized protein n=1 Tax=Gamsiella multidivaricata TaxID=101098 RepID=UPI00221FA5F9|nr:uncharacterized protein BC939DRAFT_463775 [Gamsiella multidivaricata]KAI7818127.1 hypothetical protein BC939DRAFT_463775 [Gamsiella multidivaricata]